MHSPLVPGMRTSAPSNNSRLASTAIRALHISYRRPFSMLNMIDSRPSKCPVAIATWR